MPTYLDYNATAPVRPEVIRRMQELLARPSNPSSVHSFGRDAKKHLEAARKVIADAISAWPNEIIFTASGTEANVTALRGIPGRRVLVSAVEHSSVLNSPLEGESQSTSAKGTKRDAVGGIIPVTSDGMVNPAALDEMLSYQPSPSRGEEVLVSVMLANNETGVIQPIREISDICRKHGALLHCDAVQALGKIPVDFGALGCDMMTLAAHKCGGPPGAAVLVVRRDLAIAPLLTGGGQELGRRAGTENIAAIAGFAVAVEKFDFDHMKHLRGWLGAMENVILSERSESKDLKIPRQARDDNIIFGAAAPRLPNTTCVAMPGVSNEIQLMDLDLKGFAVSAGSACSSGRIEVSHVLTAMGVPKNLASCAIRISGGWQTTRQEMESFTSAWLGLRERLAKKAG